MKKQKIISVLLIAVMVAMFSMTVFSEEQGKDTLIVGVISDAYSLDPQLQNDSHSEQIVDMIYSKLFKFKAGGGVENDLAESYEVSEDGLTWTFKLREGVKFHNGKELTAEDFKGSYDRFLGDDPYAVRLSVKNRTKMFVSVDVVDKYTVSITTDEPYGPMLALLSMPHLAVMDPDIISEFSENTGAFPKSTIGTGSYRVVSWQNGQELVLERFDDYFGEKAKIKTIKTRIIPEAASRVIALENGEVDLIKKFPAGDMERLEANPNISISTELTVGSRMFEFGCDNPIISNTKVRQAISYAVDRDEIIEGLFPGLAYPSTAPVTPVVWGYYDFGKIEQDQEKAKQLLAEAGYPDGFNTKIVTTPRYDKGVELAEVLAAQLSEVGINAEIEVLEWSVIVPMWSGLTPEEFDQPIFIMGAGTSMLDADGALRGLYTTTETGTNERSYGFYSNAEVDRLIEAGMKETDLEKRYELYKEAQEILYFEDPPGIWLFNYNTFAAGNSKLKGIQMNGVGIMHYDKMYFE